MRNRLAELERAVDVTEPCLGLLAFRQLDNAEGDRRLGLRWIMVLPRRFGGVLSYLMTKGEVVG
jgi:hypothetical protein